MFLLFEGCVVFQQLPPPLTQLQLFTQTYDDLVMCPWPDQESLTHTIYVPSKHLSSKNIQTGKLLINQRKWKCCLTLLGRV